MILREESEIKKEGKILNSITVPFPKIENFLKENKKKFKDKELLFYCAVGQRSNFGHTNIEII